MYLEHFGLREAPFRLTPQRDFFFEGAERGATLEALVYAVLHEEGIVKVTGEVGSGKTMLCRMLIERLPAHVETVFLANPSYSREDILDAIAADLKVVLASNRASGALRGLQDHLIRLYAQGHRVVVLIDEAHAMPAETLEEVRLLSNLESSRHKLLQIALFGQPELDQVLLRPGLRPLTDRITHNFRLRALSEPEVGRYLGFRMRAAGHSGPEVFAPRAVAILARGANGLTRRINVLADKALLAAFTEDLRAVGPRQVQAAIADAEFPAPVRATRRAAWIAGAIAAGMAGLAIGAAASWWLAESVAESRGDRVAALAPRAPAAAPAPAPVGSAEPSRLAPDQEERIVGYATKGQTLLEERIEAARARLRQEPDSTYCVELFFTENSDPARLERFLVRARALLPLQEIYVIPVASGPRYRIRVVYGVFADRDAAAAAARRLPPRYQRAFRAEPRSFAELRGAV